MSGPILFQGDCLEILEELEPESIDACVTDPPYGIGFMGREWDTFKPSQMDKKASSRFQQVDRFRLAKNPNLRGRKRSPALSPSQIEYDMSRAGLHRFEKWCREWAAACFRVLKPGGYLIAFGGPRTYHRLACGIEDAGFEIRESIDWIFGQGFPKSVDIAQELRKRGLICECARTTAIAPNAENVSGLRPRAGGSWPTCHRCGKPVAPEGLGSGLKPSHEPIVVARKPLQGTLLGNALTFGTGGLYIDACRLDAVGKDTPPEHPLADIGRWPPNLVLSHLPDCRPAGRVRVRNRAGAVTGEEPSARTGHVYEGLPDRRARTPYGEDGREEVLGWLCADGCPVALLDAQSGPSETPAEVSRGVSTRLNTFHITTAQRQDGVPCYGDAGGASRFFPVFRYEPKPDRLERDLGCQDLAARAGHEATASPEGAARLHSPRTGAGRTGGARNFHPTVKPIALMRWLIRLVAAPGQTVLDPFLGSGTTGMAAKLEGVGFIGIEREAEYLVIAHRRIAAVERPAVLALAEAAELEDGEAVEQLTLYEGGSSQAADLPCDTDSNQAERHDE